MSSQLSPKLFGFSITVGGRAKEVLLAALNYYTSGSGVIFGASVKRPPDFAWAQWYQLESFVRKNGQKTRQESSGWQLSET